MSLETLQNRTLSPLFKVFSGRLYAVFNASYIPAEPPLPAFHHHTLRPADVRKRSYRMDRDFYLALVPTYPVFDDLTACLGYGKDTMPVDHVPLRGFHLKESVLADWLKLETLLSTAITVLQAACYTTQPLELKLLWPSQFGYRGEYTTKRFAQYRAWTAREAFVGLLAYVTFLVWKGERDLGKARCHELMARKLPMALVWYLETGAPFSHRVDRLGAFIHPYRVEDIIDTQWDALRLLVASEVPIWVCLGDANQLPLTKERLHFNMTVFPTAQQLQMVMEDAEPQAFDPPMITDMHAFAFTTAAPLHLEDTRESFPVTHSGSRQRQNETPKDFVARREKTNELAAQSETAQEKASREQRKAHFDGKEQVMPSFSSTARMFYWEKVEGRTDGYRLRTKINKADWEQHWVESVGQRLYDDFTNEWDICSEFGDGGDEQSKPYDPYAALESSEEEDERPATRGRITGLMVDVVGLPRGTSRKDLEELCSAYGRIEKIERRRGARKASPRIWYAYSEHARNAASKLNGLMWRGCLLKAGVVDDEHWDDHVPMSGGMDHPMETQAPALAGPLPPTADPLSPARSVSPMAAEGWEGPPHPLSTTGPTTCRDSEKEILENWYGLDLEAVAVRAVNDDGLMALYKARAAVGFADGKDRDAHDTVSTVVRHFATSPKECLAAGTNKAGPFVQGGLKFTKSKYSDKVWDRWGSKEGPVYFIEEEDASTKGVSWILALPSAMSCAHVLRAGWRRDLVEMAMRLTERGIPFNTYLVNPVRGDAVEYHDNDDARQRTLGFYGKGDRLYPADHAWYVNRRDDLLENQPHVLRAALLRGGILWRLAIEYVLSKEADVTDLVTGGPGRRCLSFGGMPSFTEDGQELWDDTLTEEEENIICGVFKSTDGVNGELGVDMSWWPKPSWLESSGLGCGHWSSLCEQWFVDRVARIEAGGDDCALKSRSKWRAVLKHSRKPLHDGILPACEDAALEFLGLSGR
ncbi:hypothetical protein EIP91_009712 [Steccherinum ochraceum]|uniref:RRM domain-containing protein n=1 Tax=Steccherinum ochraceum TaxID=92696 RepID=A0A4R0RAQ7_9APHY|nr:hypothetical protein EIP91_009712 [Steccherinum ochraceum]